MLDSTKRFSNRVENYVKYRPTYPGEVIELLRGTCGLNEYSVVADIGAGTGILTKLLLSTGCRVFAVEPNQEMRTAAMAQLDVYKNLTSLSSTAEKTGLDDSAADLITVAQAFHWFDRAKVKIEFNRILKENAWLALIWNERKTTGAFLTAYEALLQKYSDDYAKVTHKNISEENIEEFFSPGICRKSVFPNQQYFSLEGLQGRLLSSSYCPAPDHPGYEPLIQELESIFNEFSEDDRVVFEYDTCVYLGKLH